MKNDHKSKNRSWRIQLILTSIYIQKSFFKYSNSTEYINLKKTHKILINHSQAKTNKRMSAKDENQWNIKFTAAFLKLFFLEKCCFFLLNKEWTHRFLYKIKCNNELGYFLNQLCVITLNLILIIPSQCRLEKSNWNVPTCLFKISTYYNAFIVSCDLFTASQCQLGTWHKYTLT